MADALTSVPQVAPAPDQPLAAAPRIAWLQPPQGWVRLSLINSLLRILTLGVYHFWGKTEVRQRIWSAIRIDGEPLEYRGTGGELCKGFLVVFFLILLPLTIISFVVPFTLQDHPVAEGGYKISGWVLVLMLSGIGMHRARRYRLSRTSFRGIRGGLSGTSTPFAWTYFWTLALVPLTLGWLQPYRALVLHRDLMQKSCFGDAKFAFAGKAGALYRRFWVVWLSGLMLLVACFAAIGALVGKEGARAPQTITPAQVGVAVAMLLSAYFVFSLVYAWYAAGRLNYFAAKTTLAGASFNLTATVPSLLWLTASNFLLRVFTLGLLSPLAEARSMRYIVDRLSIGGSIPWMHIAQNPDALLKRGEGLAEALNVDAF